MRLSDRGCALLRKTPACSLRARCARRASLDRRRCCFSSCHHRQRRQRQRRHRRQRQIKRKTRVLFISFRRKEKKCKSIGVLQTTRNGATRRRRRRRAQPVEEKGSNEQCSRQQQRRHRGHRRRLVAWRRVGESASRRECQATHRCRDRRRWRRRAQRAESGRPSWQRALWQPRRRPSASACR